MQVHKEMDENAWFILVLATIYPFGLAFVSSLMHRVTGYEESIYLYTSFFFGASGLLMLLVASSWYYKRKERYKEVKENAD